MNLEELTKSYLASLKPNYKAKAIKSYQERLRAFLVYLKTKSIKLTDDLNKKILQDYVVYLNQKGLSNNSQYVYLSSVKHFLVFLFNRDYLLFNLGEGLALPKWERQASEAYSKAQIKTFLSHISDQEPTRTRNQAIVALKLYENLRTGDITNLSVLDLNLEAQEIRLVRLKRFIKIQYETALLLKKYLKARCAFKAKVDYLFVKKSGDRMEQQTIMLALREAKR